MLPSNTPDSTSTDQSSTDSTDSTDTSTGTTSTTTTTALSTSSSTVSSSSSVSAAGSTGTGTGLSQSPPPGGLSGAAKAGIALAVLVGIGVLLAAILLFFRRKRKLNDSYGKASDEGSAFAQNGASPASGTRDSMRSTDTPRDAPQLSLRPVTQFQPKFYPNRKNAGNPLAMSMTGSASYRGSQASIAGQGQHHNLSSLSGGALERKMTPSPTNDPANPFGNHAEPPERPIGNGSRTGAPVDTSAFPAPSNGMAAGAPPATGFAAAAAAAGAGLVAGAATSRQNPPPPLDLNKPP
ncbi:MAG: hypothetical protein M1839_009384 [Geoglossum umbratile]|nr:MAG: hypothetical protein M1839_009384 [Geoglossum umbratile]